MPAIQIAINQLEFQLVGERTTTPAIVGFTKNGLSIRFDGLGDDRYFEANFILTPKGDLVMRVRDYHGTSKDKPVDVIIHKWD